MGGPVCAQVDIAPLSFTALVFRIKKVFVGRIVIGNCGEVIAQLPICVEVGICNWDRVEKEERV